MVSFGWLKLQEEEINIEEYRTLRSKLILKYFVVFWIQLCVLFGVMIWMVVNKSDIIYYFLMLHIALMIFGFQIWYFYCKYQALKRSALYNGDKSINNDHDEIKGLSLPPPSYRESINRTSKNSIFTPADDFKDTWGSKNVHSAILPFDQEYQLSIMIASPSKALNTKLN
ncbi:hypothetical protein K502DRAFT_77857 [Neoconidiobolus thromboides FSU 785]|nr:hypothetical protein K502DRAFT_77857 [Neoconidiobolus thromboides FSU 785]